MLSAPANPSVVETSKKLTVLFVDDQRILLKAVERVIKRQAKNWNSYQAESGKAAIELLKQNAFDVIVSDMRMPEMDGVELLEYVRSHYPNMIRIILSGYSNTERTIEAVRVAHQYFIKPFSTQELINALTLTHTLYKRIRNPALQSIIASIDRLPSPRKVFYEVQNALNDPDTSVESLAEIISKDSAISGKILQVVNSAFFGQSQKVNDIAQAVKILGIEPIRSLILIAGIASDHKEVLGGIISIDLYSEHCMEVALIAKSLAKRLNYSFEDQNTLFTIGLLHDVGRLILIKKYAELYTENNWREDPYSTKIHISQIEKLAEDHASIGAALVALWGLSSKIVNSIAFYQNPCALPLEDSLYTSIIYLADTISQHWRQNKAIKVEDFISNSIDPILLERMGGEDSVKNLIAPTWESDGLNSPI